MPFPTVAALANDPTSGDSARIYVSPYLNGAGTLDAADEVPLTGDNHGITSSGGIAEFNTNNGGRLVAKTRLDKSFGIATAAQGDDAKIIELITAANGTGDTARMFFAILNPDGSYDYGVCVIGDRVEEGADPDGIHVRRFTAEVIGNGSYQDTPTI
jgi:hypothetical protein